MTKEEAERRKRGEKHGLPTDVHRDDAQAELPQVFPVTSLDGAEMTPMEREKTRRISTNQPLVGSGASPSHPQSPNPASVEKTMRKAHKQLGKEDKANDRHRRKSGEEEPPERYVATTEMKDRTTLPIIGEYGENSNSNGNLSTSRGKSPGGIRHVSRSTADGNETLSHHEDRADVDENEHEELVGRADAEESRKRAFANARVSGPQHSGTGTNAVRLSTRQISPSPYLGAEQHSTT